MRKKGLKRVECPRCGASPTERHAGSAFDLDVATELEGWNSRLCACGQRYWVKSNPTDGTFDVDSSDRKPTD